MIEIDDRLMKIIGLARAGVGGERDAAVSMVRKICLEQGLDFDDVMRATDDREYTFRTGAKNQFEMDIIAQVCYHFALTEAHPGLRGNMAARYFVYTTTPAKHIETVNAAAVYLKAFRIERKKFMEDLVGAFVQKHHLYAQFKDNSESPEITAKQIEEYLRRLQFGKNMDDVEIQKQIGDGK